MAILLPIDYKIPKELVMQKISMLNRTTLIVFTPNICDRVLEKVIAPRKVQNVYAKNRKSEQNDKPRRTLEK